jgi:hypothetical protein|tara:strand:+ start:1723 stop:2343 length:621 start_codon:yes stop_codon:yes gene_type:complete
MPEGILKQEEIDLVLKKNFKNIVDKVAQGKVLSADERAVLNAGLAGEKQKERIRSWSALAKKLGVNRKTLWTLRDKHGGPEEIDLEAWQDFLEERAEGGGHFMQEDHVSDETRKLRQKLLASQAGKEEAVKKLKELELERATRELVPMSEARQTIKKVLAPLRELLEGLPGAMAVQANPTDPGMAEEACRASLDKIFRMMEKEMQK